MQQFKSEFDNFEEFAQVVLGWNFDFKQLDRGHFKADIHQIQTSEVLITKAKFNRNLLQKGEAPRGMRTFGIMPTESTPSIWRKKEVNPSRIVVFPKDCELESASLAGFKIYTVSIAEEIIDSDPKFRLSTYAERQPYRNPALLRRVIESLRATGLPE